MTAGVPARELFDRTASLLLGILNASVWSLLLSARSLLTLGLFILLANGLMRLGPTFVPASYWMDSGGAINLNPK